MRSIVLAILVSTTIEGVASANDVYPNPHLPLPAPAVAVAARDIDADGRADIVVAFAAPPRVGVCRNLGGGAFAPPVEYGLASPLPPVRLFAEDFDGDGIVDIAAVCSDLVTSAVSPLRGTGAGTFAPAVGMIVPGGDSRKCAVGDLNADGRPDLAIALYPQKTVVILHGVSAPAMFQAPMQVVAAPFATFQAIAVGDITGDGAADLLLAVHGDVSAGSVPELFVMQPAFAYALSMFALEENVQGLALADFDQDGVLDLVGGGFSVQASVKLGTNGFGSGQHPFGPALPLGMNGNELLIADLDGDGALDVAAANTGGSRAFVRQASGTTFEPPVQLGFVGTLTGIATADFDGNGTGDLVSVGTKAAKLLFVFFDPAYGPVPAPAIPLGTAVERDLGLADVDHDGLLDVVTLADTFATLGVHRSLGDGTFATADTLSLAPLREVERVALGDLDADGNVDAFVSTASATAASDYVVWARGDGSNGFLAPQVVQKTIALGRNAELADIDLDGDLDAVELSGGIYRVSRGDGAGGMTIEAHKSLAMTASATFGMKLVDMNGDGLVDLVFDVSLAGPPAIAIALGTGAATGPSFTAVTQHTGTLLSGGQGTAIEVGDVDGDGKLDVTHCIDGGPNVGGRVDFHRGIGVGAFAPAVALLHGPQVTALAAGLAVRDVDCDGFLDAVASTGSYWFALLRGGAGGFAPAEEFLDSRSFRRLDLADVDGDATLDVIGLGPVGLSVVRHLPGPAPSAPRIDAIRPASVPAVGGVITIEGRGLSSVTSLQIGTTVVGPTDFTLLGDHEIQWSPPIPSALGSSPVVATNPSGSSLPAMVTQVATVPARTVALAAPPAGLGFAIAWGATPGSIVFLAANTTGATFSFGALTILDPVFFVPLPALDAAGAGALVVPPFGVLSPVPLHLQLLTLAPPGTDPNTLTVSARRMIIAQP